MFQEEGGKKRPAIYNQQVSPSGFEELVVVFFLYKRRRKNKRAFFFNVFSLFFFILSSFPTLTITWLLHFPITRESWVWNMRSSEKERGNQWTHNVTLLPNKKPPSLTTTIIKGKWYIHIVNIKRTYLLSISWLSPDRSFCDTNCTVYKPVAVSLNLEIIKATQLLSSDSDITHYIKK